MSKYRIGPVLDTGRQVAIVKTAQLIYANLKAF